MIRTVFENTIDPKEGVKVLISRNPKITRFTKCYNILMFVRKNVSILPNVGAQLTLYLNMILSESE